MRFVTDFADQAVIVPLVLAVAAALLIAGWRRGALAWAVAVSGTLCTVLVAKVVVHSCIAAAQLPDLRSPSGHTASAAVVYGGLIALLPPTPARGVWAWSRRCCSAPASPCLSAAPGWRCTCTHGRTWRPAPLSALPARWR